MNDPRVDYFAEAWLQCTGTSPADILVVLRPYLRDMRPPQDPRPPWPVLLLEAVGDVCCDGWCL